MGESWRQAIDGVGLRCFDLHRHTVRVRIGLGARSEYLETHPCQSLTADGSRRTSRAWHECSGRARLFRIPGVLTFCHLG